MWMCGGYVENANIYIGTHERLVGDMCNEA
jgi:hypothetical protein